MAFPLTQEQRQVVENRGGALLVSAAAGSGKTRVLVERLLDRVVNEGYNIDQFLVITYTRAAAAELRARIADELNQCLAQRPGDRASAPPAWPCVPRPDLHGPRVLRAAAARVRTSAGSGARFPPVR